MTPVGSYAVAVLNRNTGGSGTPLSFTLDSLGVTEVATFNLTEVFSGALLGVFTTDKTVNVNVDVSSVFLGKFTKISSKNY